MAASDPILNRRPLLGPLWARQRTGTTYSSEGTAVGVEDARYGSEADLVLAHHDASVP
jgi:hypothetical protein